MSLTAPYLRPATPFARGSAVLVALIACAGLALQTIDALPANGGDLGRTLASLSAYFTILTNLAVAAVFAGVALEQPELGGPRAVGGALLAILLVGVVYWTLLHARTPPRPGAELSNALLHGATPVATLLWWLAFARRGALRPRDAFLWALFPLAYFVYGLVRGGITGRYPYFFMDAARLGYGRTTLNALGIAVVFVLAGLGVIALDRRRAHRRRDPS